MRILNGEPHVVLVYVGPGWGTTNRAGRCSYAGAVAQAPSMCWLVTDFLPDGTLAEWLYGRSGGESAPLRSMLKKLRMGLGIARGMLVRSHPALWWDQAWHMAWPHIC